MPPKKSKNGRKWTTVHVAIRNDAVKLIKELAVADGRTLTGYISHTLERHLREKFTPATPGLRSITTNGNRTKS